MLASLITNARCLTEGVDVPAIDAVLFADPKQSKIDIVQAAGRALRKFDGKDLDTSSSLLSWTKRQKTLAMMHSIKSSLSSLQWA